MSIRQALLALLDQRPMYGYELRQEFESRTGSTWPLNVGQIYTTLARLERDGLVEPAEDDGDGHAMYRVTDAGRSAVRTWFTTPVDRSSPPRDELAIKLAVAVSVPGGDVTGIVQSQRTHTVRAMQEYVRLKRRADDDDRDLAWLLVLDSLIFQAEAEIRWLDHCETRLARQAGQARPAGSTSPELEAAQAVPTSPGPARPAVRR